MESKNHIFGIDLYRATAILMVLLANTIYFFQLQIPAVSNLAPVIGYLGLEIFFVLSGFLLGKSFYPVFMDENFGLPQLGKFLKRKLWRILPLYFLVLLANIAIAAAMNYPYFFVWKYFLFVQNFSKTIPPFFPESWGLPVIVFGILWFSVLLFGISKVVGKKQKSAAFAVATLGLILIFIWTKWLFHTQHPQNNMAQWEAELKTVAVFRFDSIFIGVLFSWLFYVKNSFWKKAKWFFASIGFCGMAFLVVGVGSLQLLIETHSLFWNIFYLPLTSLVLSCFIPVLSQWQAVARFIGQPVLLPVRFPIAFT